MSRRLSKSSLPGVFEEKKTRSRCEPNEGKENHFERNTKDLVLRLSRSDHGEGKNFLLQSQRLSCNTQNPTSCLSLSLSPAAESRKMCARAFHLRSRAGWEALFRAPTGVPRHSTATCHRALLFLGFVLLFSYYFRQ